MQGHQAVVDGTGDGRLATHGSGAQVAHGARRDVGGDGDVALAAQQHQLDSGSVVARIDEEVLADAAQYVLGTLQVAGGFLDTDDVVDLRQALDGLRQHVADGAARHVVENLRDGHGFGDMAEVQVQAFLGRLVVVRGDQQSGIGANVLGRTGQLDRLTGAVATDRDTASDLVDHALDHFDVLTHVQRGGLTGGADRDDGIGTLLQVEIHQFAQGRPIQITLRVHGRDQCHHTARNHATAPAGKIEP